MRPNTRGFGGLDVLVRPSRARSRTSIAIHGMIATAREDRPQPEREPPARGIRHRHRDSGGVNEATAIVVE